MSFGTVQRAKLGESPSAFLGGFVQTFRQVSRGSDAFESQIWGKQPDKDVGDIRYIGYTRYTRFHPDPGKALRQGTGEQLRYEIFRRKVLADTIGAGLNTETSTYQARLAGPVQFFRNLLDTWELDSTNATVLLGMDSDDGSFAQDLLAGRVPLRGRDAKDRIAYLYRIRKILSALFRDEKVENQWLRESHTMLGKRSPMDLMLDGSMENLLLVKEYVEAAAGH